MLMPDVFRRRWILLVISRLRPCCMRLSVWTMSSMTAAEPLKLAYCLLFAYVSLNCFVTLSISDVMLRPLTSTEPVARKVLIYSDVKFSTCWRVALSNFLPNACPIARLSGAALYIT